MNHARLYRHVVAVASEEFGIPQDEIVGVCKRYPVARARHAVTWVLRNVCGWPYDTISVFVGRKVDAVVYQVEQVDEWSSRSEQARLLFRVRDRVQLVANGWPAWAGPLK